VKLKKEFARIFKSTKYGQVLVFIDYTKETKPIRLNWIEGTKFCNMELKEPDNASLDEIFDKMEMEFIDSLIEDINNRHPDTEVS